MAWFHGLMHLDLSKPTAVPMLPTRPFKAAAKARRLIRPSSNRARNDKRPEVLSHSGLGAVRPALARNPAGEPFNPRPTRNIREEGRMSQAKTTLQAELNSRGWSQGELMRKLEAAGHKVSRTTVSNWCIGRRRPLLPVATAIEVLLGIAVEPGCPGQKPVLVEVYTVAARRNGPGWIVVVRSTTGSIVGRGPYAGKLIADLRKSGRLAQWAVEARSRDAQDIAVALQQAHTLKVELNGCGR